VATRNFAQPMPRVYDIHLGLYREGMAIGRGLGVGGEWT
jgi:hypothetical protein